MQKTITEPFKLDSDFVNSYFNKPSPFGFQGLGELVYQRTYSRIKPSGDPEVWTETVERVVNGVYNMQKEWVESRGLGWVNDKGQNSAQEMFDRIWNLKFTPPGRGLWAMGSDIITKSKLYAALNNCAFVSTEDIDVRQSTPFCFLMDMSMLGVGCGFDVKGEGKCTLLPLGSAVQNATNNTTADTQDTTLESYLSFLNRQITKVNKALETATGWEVQTLKEDLQMYQVEREYILKQSDSFVPFVIPDSREGWVESLKLLIDSYFQGTKCVVFDYSKIRIAGLQLKTFGGLSSGPEPLLDLHIMVRRTLEKNINKPLTIRTIIDVMNLIGKCVVAGNVRRSSEIALGPLDSEEFINIKNYEKNPDRASYGWCSNNSVFADQSTDYSKIADRIADNGEPGVIWLDNCRKYSRMNGVVDNKDFRVVGTNPCSEQSLDNYELCTLVECFPTRCESKADFLRTLKFAYLYAKTVTLGETHWVETNRVVMRNRRIGCSLTGITDFIAIHNVNTLKEWCTEGYNTIQDWDVIYSNWLAIPRSIKTTSIKPSGCMIPSTQIRVSDGFETQPTNSTQPADYNFVTMSMQELFKHFGVDLVAELHKKTEDKWFPIDVPYQDPVYVMNSKGLPEPITKLYINGIVDTYEIHLEDGTTLECTADHKFLTYDCRDPMKNRVWKKAADLTELDEIVEI